MYLDESESTGLPSIPIENPIQSEQIIPISEKKEDESEPESNQDKFLSERTFENQFKNELAKESSPLTSANDLEEKQTSENLLMDICQLLSKHGIYILWLLKLINPQYNLLETQNLWILKPNGLSRGRGIRVFQNLEEIEAYWVAADSEMVAMKYIERPFLINKRKFDIRHWVVVTSLDPLCVWSFQDYYIRLSLNDYDQEDSNNIYAHLTNNSVAKKNKELYSQIYAHSMLLKKDFLDYCKSESSLFDSKAFHEKMHRIMTLSLESGKFNMLPRKKSFTVFGFDLMVDVDFNIWLIEVNSSPSMETNTNVTEKYVPEFFESLVQGVCDYNFVGNSNFNIGDEIGKLKMIYKKSRGYNL
jgi:tubulin monoglycylase TTLL3/8